MSPRYEGKLNARGRDGHKQDGGGDRRSPSQAIPDMAEEDPTERADREPQREDGERRQQCGIRFVGREEAAGQHHREIAIQRQVVTFHEVADAGRDDNPAGGVSLHALCRVHAPRHCHAVTPWSRLTTRT